MSSWRRWWSRDENGVLWVLGAYWEANRCNLVHWFHVLSPFPFCKHFLQFLHFTVLLFWCFDFLFFMLIWCYSMFLEFNLICLCVSLESCFKFHFSLWKWVWVILVNLLYFLLLVCQIMFICCCLLFLEFKFYCLCVGIN